MKKSAIFGIALFAIILGACEFNKSVNKDLVTGAYSKGDGIGCNGVVIQINGKRENRNTFIYGEKLNFNFDNVTGLTKKGGKVFPGMSLMIIQNEKDTVLLLPDLLSELKEGTDLSPLVLLANFTAALPFENQEKYKVYIKIWDKKGKGTFLYEMPFTIKQNKLLKIKSNDLEYSKIYLWNESLKQIVTDKNVSSKDTLVLIVEGISGMTKADDKFFPIFSMKIVDSKGETLISNPNILEHSANNGIDSDAFAKVQFAGIIAWRMKHRNNPCKLIASVRDKISGKTIDIQTELEIE